MGAQTRYARSGDIHIAYQVDGEGPDLVLIPPFFSHLELRWDDPSYASMLRRLAGFSRLISIERRGRGVSDRVVESSIEMECDDLLAVLDAVGSKRAFVFGGGDGGALALVFAALHPDRVAGAIPYATAPRTMWAEDYEIGQDEASLDLVRDVLERGDLRTVVNVSAPSLARDEAFVRSFERLLRSALSPKELVATVDARRSLDIRYVLEMIVVPVLVLHRSGDLVCDVRHSRYITDHVDGARLVELPGKDHVLWAGEVDPLLNAIEGFVTGSYTYAEPERAFAAILFTDVVGSTEHAVRVGDRSWHDLLVRYDEVVARQLQLFRGVFVKSTGDGTLATFGSPARALRCAVALVEATRELGLVIRAGIHAGEMDSTEGDIGGVAVHIARRVVDRAVDGEILVSRTIVDLVAGSEMRFDERGSFELKGVPGSWQLYAVDRGTRRR